MKRFIFFLIVLILAVWLGLHIQADPGYALFSYDHWSVEMPLWLVALIIIILFIVIHIINRICYFGHSVSGRVKTWSGKRRLRNAQHRASQGLIDLSEGNWRHAEKNLVKAGKEGDAPLINFLAAAKAAQEQGAYDRRDSYLRQAHNTNPEAKIAVELTQAQLQIHHKQLEQALATLRHLRELAPKHPYVLKLLTSVYIELKDWKSLLELLPELLHFQTDDPNFLNMIEENAYIELFADTQPDAIETLWNRLPKRLKSKATFITRYCEYLISSHQYETAEKVIRETLKKDLDKDLVRLYSIIPDLDRKKQLFTAESWLKINKNDPDLLLCLGRLCMLNQLWGKARSYFESSIAIKPTAEAYTELAQLFEQLNETTMALNNYRKAADLK